MGMQALLSEDLGARTLRRKGDLIRWGRFNPLKDHLAGAPP